ncbi:unnamed protein product [Prorocentrum cordatum]|uniref:Autophagy-related protein 9 n=1 Tax=Prorocentrum cordatum TaxID=2364126 RepID=A0ABN9TL33_9DINO|nr:unnamed protein product [Polarella glacialis]
MLAVEYAATEDYQKAERDYLFLIYKLAVIMVLLCSVFSDLKETIIPQATFVAAFPSAEALERRGEASIEEGTEVDPHDDDLVKYKIKGITKMHRVSLFFVIVARTIMFFVLLIVGVIFLLRETDYLNLILNGLGSTALHRGPPAGPVPPAAEPVPEGEGRERAARRGATHRVQVPEPQPAQDIVWFCAMVLILALSMYMYAVFILQPVTEALSDTLRVPQRGAHVQRGEGLLPQLLGQLLAARGAGGDRRHPGSARVGPRELDRRPPERRGVQETDELPGEFQVRARQARRQARGPRAGGAPRQRRRGARSDRQRPRAGRGSRGHGGDGEQSPGRRGQQAEGLRRARQAFARCCARGQPDRPPAGVGLRGRSSTCGAAPGDPAGDTGEGGRRRFRGDVEGALLVSNLMAEDMSPVASWYRT